MPANYHVQVAKICIKKEKHFVSASYESEEMRALDEAARLANVTILNEIGLDPGLDHLSIMKMIDSVKEKGWIIKGLISWCGGLPSPQHSGDGNPLGYKFSWRPKGALLAALNSAQYKKDGELICIPGPDLLKSTTPVSIWPGFALEGLPNRDSLKYQFSYGLENLHTMFRGTLRYSVGDENK